MDEEQPAGEQGRGAVEQDLGDDRGAQQASMTWPSCGTTAAHLVGGVALQRRRPRVGRVVRVALGLDGDGAVGAVLAPR